MSTVDAVRPLLVALSICGVTACGTTPPPPSGVDAPAGSTDAALDAPAANGCPRGADRLSLHGAFAVDTASVAFVTSAGKLVGVAGSHAGNPFAFSVRDVLHQDLSTVGDHDVVATNLKYFEAPSGTDCATAPAGTCRGFFALAGTYTVLELQPRYRATFALADLRERHDITNQAGAPLAGTITGCLDVPAP